MQLTKIKVSGFKSFVDPVTVSLPSNLVAIVGPNGCGKSNIIDAVCWVMGENSMKYLRGESSTDVIFNGSSARKPIGQASVELLFDNQDGSIGGEYASYSEISIRRLLSRDGESSYFLNGTRCRRRDIVDIFLGTGLGPRSYSIIGQNMISRIIEAKPDDMRVYLEEAAGISKYKERRRETENRINHTKENLARLNDLRLELDKQLANLKRQAGAAEKFKTLKQEERNIRAQWYAIQWRQLDAELVQYALQIQQQETGLESRQAALSEVNCGLEKNRDEQHAANDVFQEVQRRYYTIGNEITRIEQDINHQQERQRQWKTDIEQVEKEEQDVQERITELEEEIQELSTDQENLSPESDQANAAAETAARELTSAEEMAQTLQTQWDEFNQHTAQTAQTAQVEQTRIQHLEQKIASVKQRQGKLDQEKEQFDFAQIEKEITTISKQVSEVAGLTEDRDEQLKCVREEITTLQTTQQQTTSRLDQVRSELQKLRGQQASLEALQQTALGQRNNPVLPWLKQHQLDQQPRLAQGIEVETGWEHAVEKVLGSYLQAICVDDLSDVAGKVTQFDAGNLCVYTAHAAQEKSKPNASTLLNKVKSKWPLESLLSYVYTAESLSEALALCKSLSAHESVMTRDGIWLSPSWLRISRDENPEAGVFQREQELKQLATQIKTLVETQEELEKNIAQMRDRLKQLEQQRGQLEQASHQFHAQSAEVQAQYKIKQARLTELKARVEHVTKELKECADQLEQAQTELTQSRSTWQQAMSDMEQHAKQREKLLNEREQKRTALHQAREKVNTTKQHAHQLEIRLQTTRSQQASLKQTVTHMQTQLAALDKRKTALQNDLDAAPPVDALQKNLNGALAKRLLIEEELYAARTGMESVEQSLRLLDSKRQEIEHEITKVRNVLETLRMDRQGLKVKAETLTEQVKELSFILEDVLKTLPENVTSQEWYTQLEHVTQRIARLGAINLVAIEEFATCSERKEYLDKQYDDLQEGLTTLENAIAKIDKETRARFKETFDKVNERFQELFPQVFGGGRAYLELTGENLLDSGITVMACPPGKRNSTIHLLSGGEKAMTAIALVFSIFHLNPAPFCLLDEVDAPLDDANIGRFCQLVKKMAEKTQFIFISHNKLAIEMAEHLMGVTMHEPGVSRLVSVNVQEAMSLAGV